MPATGSHPPIPRQPIGRTFVAAITLLGIFAALQVLAVLWRFLPLVSQQVAESAAARQLTQAGTVEEKEAVKPYRPPPKPAPGTEEAKALRAQADKMFRVGEFEQSLQFLNEAAELVPDDPQTLFRQAQTLDRLDRFEEAAMALQAFLKHPDLPADIRQQCEKKLEQYAAMAKTASPSSMAPAGSATGTEEMDSGSPLRDDVGLQPGSSLGIIDARLRDGEGGKKVLSVAIKSRPGVNVAYEDFELHVSFYEETPEGEIVMTDSPLPYQWISPPIDWKDNEPEIFQMEYTPPSAGEDASAGRKFAGYTVGVYYNRELQDSRADPGRLDKQVPMPLYLKFNESGQ